jgi:hypothetical protein
MALILPMSFMVFYIFALGIYTFRVRSSSVNNKETHIKFFKTYDMSLGGPPEYVVRVGRHYDNQYQVPILFLITAGLCLVHQIDSLIPAVLSWMFVISRLIHSYIHLGQNNIIYRFLSYASGFIIVLALWVLILMNYLIL